ncbi:Ribosomal oxygenase 1 [Nymphon striatum]|nr:Ribosomal oxygenase 1 [Nymphon striatum]
MKETKRVEIPKVKVDKSKKKKFNVMKKVKQKKLKNWKLIKRIENRHVASKVLKNKAVIKTVNKVIDQGKKKKKLKQSETKTKSPQIMNGKLESTSVELCDSASLAEQTFRWFIHPIKPIDFFNNAWEKKPILIQRHDGNYYKNIFSTKEFDQILKKEEVHFITNLDVTVYKNGKRETLTPTGRAYASRVWTEYEAGHSIRMLNPQSFSKSVWNLLATLQGYFNCGVGTNMYLTPAGSQGFAPHYDDIEAFVIQIEGQKRWKLYQPSACSKFRLFFSVENFTEEEIGKPILDVCLNEGDMLYFPRGIIHQASTPDHTHSLHLTISTFQKNTWADLLEKLIPRALEFAADEDIEFRRGLPIDYLSYMGIANSDLHDSKRKKFSNMVENLMTKLIKLAPIDAAVDQVSKEYIHNSLPPCLTKEEKKRSVHEAQIKIEDGKVINKIRLQPSIEIRLIRKTILRLIAEDTPVIYHSVNNSRVYQEREMQSYIISPEFADAVEMLQHSYPSYVRIADLPIEDGADCMEFALQLYKRGLIITKEILN